MLKHLFITVDECGRPDNYSFPVEISDDTLEFGSSLLKHFVSEEFPQFIIIKDIENHEHFFNIDTIIHGVIVDDEEVDAHENGEENLG